MSHVVNTTGFCDVSNHNKENASCIPDSSSENTLVSATDSDLISLTDTTVSRKMVINWNPDHHTLPTENVSPISENNLDLDQITLTSQDVNRFSDNETHNQDGISIDNTFESLYKMPIVGYEVQEERSRFTIFKIQIIHIPTKTKWFVFRRYADFIRLNRKLQIEFPGLRFVLPPKRWFGNNFDPLFLEDRQIGLQAYINNIIAHKKISESLPVRSFFCLDDPPKPHECLEESMAMCQYYEQKVFELENSVRQKDSEIVVLKSRIDYMLTQQEALLKAFKVECDLTKKNRNIEGLNHDFNLALINMCEETLKNRGSHPSSSRSSTVNLSSGDDGTNLRKLSLPSSLRKALNKNFLSEQTLSSNFSSIASIFRS